MLNKQGIANLVMREMKGNNTPQISQVSFPAKKNYMGKRLF
jgi:hypothetical protein